MGILLSHLVPPGLTCISHRTVAGTSKCCMRCCYCYHSFPSSCTHVHASLILKSEAKPSLNITGIRFTCVLPPPAQQNVPQELSVLVSANFLCPWPSLFPQRHTGAALSKGLSWQAALCTQQHLKGNTPAVAPPQPLWPCCRSACTLRSWPGPALPPAQRLKHC